MTSSEYGKYVFLIVDLNFITSLTSRWSLPLTSRFSRELQESLSAAAQAKRSGEAKVIAARAEVSAARLMRDAADILNSPAALSIRTLDALQTMARQANTKVVFVVSLSQIQTCLSSYVFFANIDNFWVVLLDSP